MTQELKYSAFHWVKGRRRVRGHGGRFCLSAYARCFRNTRLGEVVIFAQSVFLSGRFFFGDGSLLVPTLEDRARAEVEGVDLPERIRWLHS